MPELPDVEVYRRYLDSTSLRQRIVRVQVRAPRLLKGVSSEQLAAGLRGHAFQSTRRHGKFLFAGLDDGWWLVLHFGMSGHLAYFGDAAGDPKFDQMLITFAGGHHLAYVAPRKLGQIALVDDVGAYVRGKRLGPDVLDPHFDLSAFEQALAGKHAMIKSVLMDQHIMAGIGNIYSDEVLFQAKVHPRTKVSELGGKQLAAIFQAMKDVLHTAIARHADTSRLPASYLIPHRREGEECPVCGGRVEKVRVGARTAYYCPACQAERR